MVFTPRKGLRPIVMVVSRAISVQSTLSSGKLLNHIIFPSMLVKMCFPFSCFSYSAATLNPFTNTFEVEFVASLVYFISIVRGVES